MIDDVRQRIRKLEDAVRALTEKPVVFFKRLHPDAVIPQYKSTEAAGMDLFALEDTTLCGTSVTVSNANQLGIPSKNGLIPVTASSKLVRLGFAIELPRGYEAQVRPRSGLSTKGVTIPNSPGTVDSDYRGEMMVIMSYNGDGNFRISKGDRIAQLVITKVAQASIVDVGDEQLSSTDRGTGGFGSTGK